MKTMGDVQMLFPMEPKEFWQKLKIIAEQVVIEHNNPVPLLKALDKNGQRPLLTAREVCAMFKISRPTLYDRMNHGPSNECRIGSVGRYFTQPGAGFEYTLKIHLNFAHNLFYHPVTS